MRLPAPLPIRTPRCRPFLAVALALLVAGGRPGWSQALASADVAVVEENGENVRLRIRGAEYLAFPTESARRLLERPRTLEIRLRELEEQLAAKDAYITALEETNGTLERHIALQGELLTQTQAVQVAYREVYADLRRLQPVSEPLLALSGGLGAVRGRAGPERDLLPTFLLGLKVRRFNVWGFLHAEQSGLLFGLNSPLRLPRLSL